jgi:hypothetical protein
MRATGPGHASVPIDTAPAASLTPTASSQRSGDDRSQRCGGKVRQRDTHPSDLRELRHFLPGKVQNRGCSGLGLFPFRRDRETAYLECLVCAVGRADLEPERDCGQPEGRAHVAVLDQPQPARLNVNGAAGLVVVEPEDVLAAAVAPDAERLPACTTTTSMAAKMRVITMIPMFLRMLRMLGRVARTKLRNKNAGLTAWVVPGGVSLLAVEPGGVARPPARWPGPHGGCPGAGRSRGGPVTGCGGHHGVLQLGVWVTHDRGPQPGRPVS